MNLAERVVERGGNVHLLCRSQPSLVYNIGPGPQVDQRLEHILPRSGNMNATMAATQEHGIGYSEYSKVPWLRRSGTNSVLLILHLLTLGSLPFLLVTCIVLATGDIYYDEIGPNGLLKSWSMANKIIAWLLLLFPLILIGTVVLTIAGF
jgi:hypothetical protein